MEYFKVNNLEKYQAYKDGRKIYWIKLYKSILKDYDFTALTDAEKWHLIGLWLLATDMDNRIPMDSKFVSRHISASGNINLQKFVDVGFIGLYDSVRIRTIAHEGVGVSTEKESDIDILENDINENDTKTLVRNYAGEAQLVFDHYKTFHPTSTFNKKAGDAVIARLKESYTVETLIMAIDGCHQTPHNCGVNDRGEKFQGLALIMRNGEQVERFAGNAVDPPKPRTGVGVRITQQDDGLLDRTRNNLKAMEDFINDPIGPK